MAFALVTACEKDGPSVAQDDSEETENGSSSSDSDDSQGTGVDTVDPVIDDDYSDDVLNISDFSKTIYVTWNGSAASVTGSDGVIDCSVSGGHVTLGTSSSAVEGMNIVLSGSGSDGALKVYNSDKFVITLAGVSLTSKTGAAVNSQCKKRVFILLQENTNNTLADAVTYSDVPSGEDSKGCLFSEGQLVVTGTGRLNISGNSKHAIASDDYIRHNNGAVYVTTAVSDGIHVNDYFRIDAGTLDITASGDGIECDEGYINIAGGTLTIKSAGDGLKTSYEGTSTDVTPYVNVSDGTVGITTTGAKGMGIKAASDVIISGGTLTSSVSGAGSKAIKADNNVSIGGGTLTLNTTGASMYDSSDKDISSPACIKAENNVTISGGDITSKSTGTGGKCVSCYSFTMKDGTLSATTSGSGYSYSSLSSKSKAIKASNLVSISGGTITVSTTGQTAEGIESKGNMTVSGGYVSVYSKCDDGINTAGTYSQTGGYVYTYAASNDGLDSNYGRSGAIVISGGVLMAHGTSSPEEGIDADNNGYVSIKGGTVFSSGGQQGGGSSSTPSCSQPTLFIQNSSLTAGYFTVTDSDGKVIMSCYVPRAMSQCSSFVSSSSFTSGSSYKYGVVSAAPSSPTTLWNPYYFDGGTVSGTLSSSYTAGSGCTTTGSSSSGGGTPGGGGRPW